MQKGEVKAGGLMGVEGRWTGSDDPEVEAELWELPDSNWVNWALSILTSGKILVGKEILVLSSITWRGEIHREKEL